MRPPCVVEVVVLGDGLADIAVLLGGARGVELLELEADVHHGLQQVERAEHVRGDGLVGAVPRLADVGLGAEVEDVRPVGGRLLQLADQVVDGRSIRQVGEVHLQAVAQVPDVVQGAARGCADESVHVRAELDEGIGEMGAHEAVGSGDENRPRLVDLPEVAAEASERFACPESVVRHGAYASASVSKRTVRPGLGSLRSGAFTALSLLVVSGVAALIGVVIAREFGRTEETDGLLAAYGLFIVIAVASQAIRVAVLPSLARAQEDRRLAGELAGYAGAVCVIAIPLLLAAGVWTEELGRHLTGDESDVARETAADALRWMVPAGVMHLFAGLASSGLAALDDYGTAALGYAAGSAAGLTLIVLRVEPDGIVAVAWGVMLTSAIALVVPAAGLAIRALRARMPPTAVRPSGPPLRKRFGAFGVGAALPVALQLLYVVSLPFAAEVGTGGATTFVYAYLAASSLVTVTAGSLGLVTAVPLARREFTVPETVRHVVSASWFALVLVGAAAGAFAVAGGEVVRAILGAPYGGDVGTDLGRLVVALSPWTFISIGVAIAFPLAFVGGRTRRLPWIAAGAVVLQVPLAWAGVRLFDLDGLAIALACSTLAVLVALLVELRALAGAARGLATAAVVVSGLTLAAFLPPSLVLGSVAAAVTGLVLYVALLAVARPRPLIASWQYLRALR